jgi:hypothetical protein
MLFRLLGGRKATLVIGFGVLVALNDILTLGITAESLDQIRGGVLAFAGLEGARDVVETYRAMKPDHDLLDTSADAYDDDAEV